jgi:hypothetical protein
VRAIFAVLPWLAVTLVGPAAAAGPIQLTIHEGRVSLVAESVTVRQILAEWARVGQTQIVNGERVPGGLVSLQLTNVPEREALDLLLRTAAGYLAVSRTAGPTESSQFARILIMPTSTAATAPSRPVVAAEAAPVFPSPAPSPVFAPSGAERVLGPDGQPVPDDQDDNPAAPRPQPYVPLPPGFAEPPPEQPVRGGASPTTPAAPVGVPVPGMIVPPAQPAQPTPVEVQPIGPQDQ